MDWHIIIEMLLAMIPPGIAIVIWLIRLDGKVSMHKELFDILLKDISIDETKRAKAAEVLDSKTAHSTERVDAKLETIIEKLVRVEERVARLQDEIVTKSTREKP